jgi:hypothetical protein
MLEKMLAYLPSLDIRTSNPGDIVTQFEVKNQNKWGRRKQIKNRKENEFMIKKKFDNPFAKKHKEMPKIKSLEQLKKLPRYSPSKQMPIKVKNAYLEYKSSALAKTHLKLQYPKSSTHLVKLPKSILMKSLEDSP